MSATTGIFTAFLSSYINFTDSKFGTAVLIISQPAFSSSTACLTFPSTSLQFTVPAETVRQWKYFAIVKSFNTVDVEVPGQGTDQDGENEGEGDEMSAGDTDTDTPEEGDTTTPEPEETTPAPEQNPPTGVVLAVVPMVVAAAAIVISKKR